MAPVAGRRWVWSHIAQQIAHIGFSNFVLVDHDHVDEPNLNRMIGSRPKDAEDRVLKAAVIERTVKSINPNANVLAVPTRWQESALPYLALSRGV